MFCCCGHLAHTRFAAVDNGDNRCIAFLVNVAVGVGQASTVILFLVGWCWSVGWGITMLTISSKSTCLFTLYFISGAILLSDDFYRHFSADNF